MDDGEVRHAHAPTTFWIPDRDRRERLRPGDFAKLIFRISVDSPEEPVAVESMWVVVRERIFGGYLGLLDNEPDSIDENDAFWVGTELPFGPEHIINIMDGDAASISLATAEPRTRWPE